MKRKVLIAAEPYERRQRVHEPTIHPDPFIAVIPPNIELSELTEDCGHLEGNNCSIYNDPKRPDACAIMEVGSDECLDARAKAGFSD